MNFDLTEEQQALSELSKQIFEGSSPVDRVEEIETTEDRFDRALWGELANANLLGVAIPEEYGGLGFGVFELALILEQQGRTVAPVPLLPTLVMGALPIVEYGTDEQQSRLLPAIASGKCIVTGSFQEWGANNPLNTSMEAEYSQGKWTLSGTKPAVPAAHIADYILIPAKTGPEDSCLFLVEREADGMEFTPNITTNRELQAQIDCDTVPAEPLGDPAQGNLSIIWMLERINVATSAIAVGCCAKATEMAAEYTSEREQFGRPLSHNQAVTQRAADCYIGTDAMRLVLWQAAWRLDAGYPASEEVRIAKWWASEIGQKVVHDVQHLHGGMGADVDYPVHRYFLWVKQLENFLGGGSSQLAELGSLITTKAKTNTFTY